MESLNETTPELPQVPSRIGGRGLAAFRHHNYRLFWGGQLVSLAGTWAQNMAQSWLVLQLSHSAFILGIVGALQFLPMLVLGLFGGLIADRFPKRSIIIITQATAAVLALVLGVLTAAGWVQVWHVMILALFLGIVNAVDMPTRQAFVVEMVGRDDLMSAVALNSSVFNAARIFGPAIGGLLIAWVGIAFCFIFNGLSFFAVIGGLLLMDMSRLHVVERGAKHTVWKGLREGLGYVRHTRDAFMAIALVGVVSLFALNFNTLNPLIADGVLSVGAQGYGSMMSAMGVGSVIAAISVAFLFQKPSRLLIVGSTMMVAIFEVIYAQTNQFVLVLILMMLLGMAATALTANANSMLQTTTPDHLRGRVMSVYATVFAGITPFGAFYAGTLASFMGPQFTMGLSGILAGIGGVFALLTGWHRETALVAGYRSSRSPHSEPSD